MNHNYSDTIQLFEYSEKLTGVYNARNKSISATGLTNQDMEDIETLLRRMHQEHSNKLLPFDEYTFQYVPTITQPYQEKLIWVNALCSGQEDDWREKIIFVEGGGNCYFKVDVNLGTGDYYKLVINDDK